MRRLQISLLAAVAVIGFASITHAADMPTKAPPMAPVVAPASSWTGFYVGGEVGGKWTDGNWNTTCLTDDGVCPGFSLDPSSSQKLQPSSLRAGGYAGYNWQVSNWVLGAEVDFAWANSTKTVTGIPGCSVAPAFCGAYTGAGITAANDSASIRSTWDGAIRARLGFLVTPNWLVYAAGGFAEQGAQSTVNCFGPTSPWCQTTRSQTFNGALPGWTIGGGLEWMVTNHWLARAEYRYSDFGKWNNTYFSGTPDQINTTIKFTTQIATVGLAYKW
jgi:outer membrane immunogenic protein